MSELRFDGRTAIVTGAGGNPSLGRAFALLLAARGANVVVNDIGRSEAPGYTGNASAEAVMEEIRAAGGIAIANHDTVASPEGGQAIVDAALGAFGAIDILVNNAGISIAAPFDEMTPIDIQRHLDVNAGGCIWTTRAAWPHMREQGYGRVINVASGAIAGFAQLVAYGASKGAVYALSRALAAEGRPLGIKVNSLNPGAFTRMLAAQQEETGVMYRIAQATQPAELVAPAVLVLAHDRCPVTGECFEAVAGVVRRIVLGQTEGVHDDRMTPETLIERWDEVMDGTQANIGIAELDTSEWHIKPYRT